jgi:hypothetical protein
MSNDRLARLMDITVAKVTREVRVPDRLRVALTTTSYDESVMAQVALEFNSVPAITMDNLMNQAGISGRLLYVIRENKFYWKAQRERGGDNSPTAYGVLTKINGRWQELWLTAKNNAREVHKEALLRISETTNTAILSDTLMTVSTILTWSEIGRIVYDDRFRIDPPAVMVP